MAASSYSSREPFIAYLTLFQSRTALINLALGVTSAAAQSGVVLERKLASLLKEKIEIDVLTNQDVLRYLQLKKFIARDKRNLVAKDKPNKERYPGISLREEGGSLRVFDKTDTGLSKVSVYRIDQWMADQRIRSVIGVPTPSNVNEIVEFAHVLGVISKQTNSWTRAGQVAARLRANRRTAEDNPFVLGPESAIILRQLIEHDGTMLAATLDMLMELPGPTVSRDALARLLPKIASDALALAKSKGCSPEVMHVGKAFLKTVENTGKKREKMSDAPGVLEHRVTPRVEWLTDLGALSKEGLARNGFEYKLTEDARVLRDAIEGWLSKAQSADDAVLSFWQRSRFSSEISVLFATEQVREAFLKAYLLLKRPIGPVAIRDVCLVAGMGLRDHAWRIPELEAEMIRLAESEDRVNLSGGRYRREPEFVYMSDEVLKDLT